MCDGNGICARERRDASETLMCLVKDISFSPSRSLDLTSHLTHMLKSPKSRSKILISLFLFVFKKKEKVADDVCIAIREREREKKMTYRHRQRQGRRYRHADCWEGSVQ